MIQGERNIKISIDDTAIRKLIQAVDLASDKILKHSSFSPSVQNSGAGIFDTASGKFGVSLKTNQNELSAGDKKFEELTKKMLGDFEGMLASTQKMLQTVGLIDSEIGKIFQMIIQLVNTLSKGFEFGKSIIGFIANLIIPGSGTLLDEMTGSGNNIHNPLALRDADNIYPISSNYSKVVYVIPKDTVIRGRDIHTTWAVEEKINSSVTL